jgi:hypothetical protein
MAGWGKDVRRKKKRKNQADETFMSDIQRVCLLSSLSSALEMVLTRGDAGTLNDNGWAFQQR